MLAKGENQGVGRNLDIDKGMGYWYGTGIEILNV